MKQSLRTFLQDTYTQNKTNRFLSARDFLELEPFLSEHHVPEKHFLYREGEPSDFMLFLTHGKAQATKKVHYKRQIVLGLYHPGTILGETCLIGQAPRSMTVKTIEDSSVLVLSRKKFVALNEEKPVLGNRVLQLMMHTAGRRLEMAYTRLASVF